MNLMDRLTSLGPKRILALDGGGIRGALTVGYLVRMEALLRDRHQTA
jgi:patatin-like phospholipase/acyl hydrolase